MMTKTLLVSVVILVAGATACYGGANENAKAAIHVLAHDPDLTCSRNFPVIALCDEIVTTYEGCGDVDFFPVFFDLVEYQEGAVVSRTVMDKQAGTLTLFAFGEGQGLSEHTAPFDALVYLLDGDLSPQFGNKVHHRYRGHRNPEGHAMDFALKLRDNHGYRLGGAGGGGGVGCRLVVWSWGAV